MPNTKSAIKAMRQSIRRRARNAKTIGNIKKSSKSVKKSAASGNADEAKKALSEAFAALDKAAKNNVIHKNKASRLKSRLSKLVGKTK